MKASLAYTFMQCVGTDLDAKGETYGLCSCPLAEFRHEKGTDSHPSFRVSLGPRTSWGKCYACQWSGPLGDLLMQLQKHKADNVDYAGAYALLDKEMDGIQVIADPEAKPGREFYPFPEELLASYPYAWQCPEAMEYLNSRKGGVYPLEVLQAFDLRWDGMRQRVCFPYRDAAGVFCGLHGRTTIKEEPAYMAYGYKGNRNTSILLGEHWVDLDKPVVVAESVFDAARCYQAYRNVVTPRMASPDPRAFEWLCGVFHLVLVFDGDKAGQTAVQKLLKARKKNRITQVVELPGSHDADSLGITKLAPLLEEKLKLAGGLDPLIL